MPNLRLLSCLSLIQAFLLFPAGSSLAFDAEGTESGELPIVGGQEELGHPAVGALGAMQIGLGYAGPFCSCTLIAPQWVLTAAHCVTPLPSEGFNPTALLTEVILGNDARPLAAGAGPMQGKSYRVDKLIPHPKYDPQKTENDIALVHLAQPVEDVEPVAYQAEALLGSLVKAVGILYVGFGVTDGVSQQGAGIKRSVHVKIKSLMEKSYMSAGEGVGVCFGDSGGPGMWEKEDGSLAIIGVNSTVFGMGAEDPCDGNSFQTRVDVFSAWINNYLISPNPSCLKDAGMCRCPESCQKNGHCDDSKCEWYNCSRVWHCIQGCPEGDEACRQLCYFRGTEEARAHLQPMAWCKVTLCANKKDEEADVCLLNNCTEKAVACIPSEVGVGDCRSVGACMQGCPLEDDNCQNGCYAKGSLAARGQYDSLWDCVNQQCADRPYFSPVASCAWEECGSLMNECFPSMECSMVTGGCSAGTACSVTPTGRYDCFPTQGLLKSEACEVGRETLPCDDGLSCVPGLPAVPESADEAFPLPERMCLTTCAQGSQCDKGERCEIDSHPELGGLGVCVCTDADQDGFCLSADCDDTDSSIPGDAEVCGDGVDNNCDGQIDEDCVVPVPEQPSESDGGCAMGYTEHSGGPVALLLLVLIACLACIQGWHKR